MKKWMIMGLLAPMLALTTGCNDDDDPGTIVDEAAGRSELSTLVTAVTAAGLVETLEGEGPFTVFAPNNEAFAALPPGTLEALLADTAKLTKILTYHVVAGDLKAADVVAADKLTTVQGKTVKITVNENGAFVNGAKIIKTDIDASNGTLHMIDGVLIP